MDVYGNSSLQSYPIDVTSLLPPPEVISIPDADLAAVVRDTLGLSPGVALTTRTMLELRGLNARNANIQDLTGLEYAHGLNFLYLDGEVVNGSYANSNEISDISALSGG